MRKRIKTMKTVIAALMLCGTALTPALAQNCTSPTRCDELGYTRTSEECKNVSKLACPFNSDKFFCPTAVISGQIYYTDNTISDDVIEEKTPAGIILITDFGKFIISLQESISTWGPTSTEIPCLTNIEQNNLHSDIDGQTNTACIMEQTKSHPAAKYCAEYTLNSDNKNFSNWYLPATGELISIATQFDAINKGLEKLSATQLSQDYYWSSTQAAKNRAWPILMPKGTSYFAGKDHTIRLRCLHKI